MSKTLESHLKSKKRLINSKLEKLKLLTASGNDKTVLYDALSEIDKQLAKLQKDKPKKGQ